MQRRTVVNNLGIKSCKNKNELMRKKAARIRMNLRKGRMAPNKMGKVKNLFFLCIVCIMACAFAGCGGKGNRSENIMEQLPEGFDFGSGAGGWATYFNLNSDGTFTGRYHDSDMGDTGEGYPNGTVYICNFDGKFSLPKQVNESTYSMELEYLNTEGTPGKEYCEDDTRYIDSEAYGFEDAEEFLIYLPGCPLEQIPEEFFIWSSVNTEIRKTLPGGYYGIYNVNGKKGFVGMAEDSLWSRRYHLQQGRFRAELRPSYYDESHLIFFGENEETLVNLCFEWEEDAQRKFQAYDSEGSGEYEISLRFLKDIRTVQAAVKAQDPAVKMCMLPGQWQVTPKQDITITEQTGYDFSPWGGSAAGTWEGKMVFD